MNSSFHKSRRNFLTTVGSGMVAIAAGSTSAISTVSAQEGDWPYGYEWGVEANMPIDMAVTTDSVVTYEIDDLNNQTLLVARDIEDGTVEWRESFSETFFHGSGLAVGGGAVFAGGAEEFTRLDLETGSREWTIDIEYVSGKPKYHSGSVIVALQNENKAVEELVSLDASTGNINWQTELDRTTHGSPAIIEETVYYGRSGFQLSDGEILFDINYGGSEPRYKRFDNKLILTTWEEEGEENMFSIEPGTSSINWAQNIVGNVFAEPIRVGDTFYIGTRGRSVYSIDVDSGSILWESENIGQISEQVAFSNGTVIAPTLGNLFGLDSETGETEWEVRLATEGEGLGPLRFSNDDLIITREYLSGPDGTERYVIPGSVSKLSTDAEPLPSLDITKNPPEPAVGDEIRFRAKIGDTQESTMYWSIWNDDASSEDSPGDINLYQDTGTEQTYVAEKSGNYSVICVLIDQQRPVITYLSEPIKISNSTPNSPAPVFQQAENVSDSPLAVAGLGAAAVGLGYTVYRGISSGTTENGHTDKTQQIAETENNPRVDERLDETVTVDSYAAITVGEQIVSDSRVSIYDGTVDHHTVWTITPPSGETISTTQATEFVDRITPWSRMDIHPNLMAVYGSGSDPLPWAAIEQADYPQVTDEVNRLSIVETCNALQEICEALHHVHRYGTTYENLTTGSILYTDDGEIKLRGVLDQFEDPDPWYYAPEEFNGESTERSTIYRIGLIAYELLTGTLPYAEYPNGPVQEAIESSELIPPFEQIEDLSTELTSILTRALSKSPNDRYETVLHLRDELDDLDVT